VSTAYSLGGLEVRHPPVDEPASHCLAGADGIAVAARSHESLRLLVAADVEQYGLMVSHTFRRAVKAGLPLTGIAEQLDEAITRVSMPSVCAILVDVTAAGFTVLHRGGPAPLVIRSDGALTRVVPSMPGPPLGPHESFARDSKGDFVPAGATDVLLVTTPGSVEPSMHAIASAASASLRDLWSALLQVGLNHGGNAVALASPTSP